MERRFERVWENLRDRRDGGENFAEVLRSTPSSDLVAALSVAGMDDPVAANAIATELLNRLRGAPYLGASLVALVTSLLIVGLDWAFTGTLLVFEAGWRARILLLATLGIALFSVLTFAMWRRRFPRLRSWVGRNRAF